MVSFLSVNSFFSTFSLGINFFNDCSYERENSLTNYKPAWNDSHLPPSALHPSERHDMFETVSVVTGRNSNAQTSGVSCPGIKLRVGDVWNFRLLGSLQMSRSNICIKTLLWFCSLLERFTTLVLIFMTKFKIDQDNKILRFLRLHVLCLL